MTSVSLPDPVVLRTGRPRVDVRALERALRERAGGEVRFDAGSRGAYSTDASNYRQIPIGVVVPRTVDDAVQAIAVCREHGAPVVSRGGGTSLAGQACNVAVVIDWSKSCHGLVSVDLAAKTSSGPSGSSRRFRPGQPDEPGQGSRALPDRRKPAPRRLLDAARLRYVLQLSDDDGRFDRAVMRCVGVGKCRHSDGGVMCPSYMATREEEHSTRGRSRLLFEMLEGHADSPVTAGWRSTEVRDALDLCLACKGCKKDCPVEVEDRKS